MEDPFFVATINLFVIVVKAVARLDICTGLGNLPHMQLLDPFHFLTVLFRSFTAECEFNGLSKRQVCLTIAVFVGLHFESRTLTFCIGPHSNMFQFAMCGELRELCNVV